MIRYFTCPKCKTRIRVSLIGSQHDVCFWCDGAVKLPMPFTPDALTRAHPEGYIPPRPGTQPKGPKE